MSHTSLSTVLSIKDVRSQGGGGLFSADVFWIRGFLLFGAKNIGFFEIYRVSARTREEDE